MNANGTDCDLPATGLSHAGENQGGSVGFCVVGYRCRYSLLRDKAYNQRQHDRQSHSERQIHPPAARIVMPEHDTHYADHQRKDDRDENQVGGLARHTVALRMNKLAIVSEYGTCSAARCAAPQAGSERW